MSATLGLGVLAAAAPADSTFTFHRIAASDRYATAAAFNEAAFPSGNSHIYLADGLPGHQSDALAASGWGGIYGTGSLLTDNTDTVPSATMSAISTLKVTTIDIMGGTSSVSSAQETQLKNAGYAVNRIAGASRLDTMLSIDGPIPQSMVGTDASGARTAFLASADDSHLADALAAGGVAYGKKFPVILTESTSSTMPTQTRDAIKVLGIQHLIVVGGNAAVPSSQYTPAPSGVAKVDVEAGADRSATSKVFADYAISHGFAKDSKMELARGDDGADALASAPYAGTQDVWPTCVTNSTSDVGSCPSFASEYKATLTGISAIAGGTDAVPDSEASTVASAGGGSFP